MQLQNQKFTRRREKARKMKALFPTMFFRVQQIDIDNSNDYTFLTYIYKPITSD